MKARAYNVFLQGQFKDSEVTYDSDELNHGIVEAWVGYTVALKGGYSFTYSIRGHTSELKHGTGDRNVVWGGLLITKSFI
ncbi:MAG: lipid A deacylase LpxR family protein [Gammaproteobacteria bacterium]|nr:lipid A deacylase LpxR family protein [Gammaproteobacteria bacterium]